MISDDISSRKKKSREKSRSVPGSERVGLRLVPYLVRNYVGDEDN